VKAQDVQEDWTQDDAILVPPADADAKAWAYAVVACSPPVFMASATARAYDLTLSSRPDTAKA
jgi:hypothetical protein